MYPESGEHRVDSKDNDYAVNKLVRTKVTYSNKSSRFRIQTRDFERQYAHLYAVRLSAMRKDLIPAAKKKWGKDISIKQLSELEVDERCVIIGTVFKDMQLKPSILKEISEKQDIDVQPVGHRFISDTDKLILEDELQRIIIQGLDINEFSTGVIIAILGKELDEDRGTFHVEDHCFKQLGLQPERPLIEADQYVAIISGLELGDVNENLMSVQLMVDLLTGQLGDINQQYASADIVRVIIAGNSLSESTRSKDQLVKARYLTKKNSANSVEAIKTLDDILVQFVASVDVDLMPGNLDPANYVLPQQPLHRCMFPLSTHYETFSCVTNPYEFEINGVRFLGTSGQSISDIGRFSEVDDNLKILRSTLEWHHLAPTSPDTLGCYPYYDTDPFIIDDTPHVYFSGNQPKYQSELFEGPEDQKVRLVNIPRFSESGICALINLRTLESQPLSFHHNLDF